MKLKEVRLRRFKRFTDFTISDLPSSARLCIIAGPNGCGKSSFFEALNVWQRQHHIGVNWDPTYYVKEPELEGQLGQHEAVQVQFHSSYDARTKKAIYIRSAYRNDPQFQLKSITKLASVLDENRLENLIQNDATVGSNYQRLASQALEDVFDTADENTTIKDFRETVIGEIKRATQRLFPNLVMNGLGNPLTSGTFKFDKGTSKGFSYKNLSGGEKAAFDLLLDIIVKRREFDDTVFCIDEPETHMNSRLQGSLLKELFSAISGNSQLWLATHSVGMMRAARDLAAENPGEVIFLDFGGLNFDEAQVTSPQKPNRRFWQKVLEVGFDDFAALVAPIEVVLCEGSPEGAAGKSAGMDAKIYDHIFGEEFPDTRFIAGGSSSQVLSDKLALMEAMQSLVKGTIIRRLVDRDDLSDLEIEEFQRAGVAVLNRRHLESYLFDDELLHILAVKSGKPEKADSLVAAKLEFLRLANADPQRGRPEDDMKASSGPIVAMLKKELSLKQAGGTPKDFMRVTMAPLLVPGTTVYDELRSAVFQRS